MCAKFGLPVLEFRSEMKEIKSAHYLIIARLQRLIIAVLFGLPAALVVGAHGPDSNVRAVYVSTRSGNTLDETAARLWDLLAQPCCVSAAFQLAGAARDRSCRV